MAFLPIKDFSPDAPTSRPGVLISCEGWAPTLYGMETYGEHVESGSQVTATIVSGASYEGSTPATPIYRNKVNYAFGQQRLFWADGLLLTNVSFTLHDISRSTTASGSYSLTALGAWASTVYGGEVFAAARTEVIQRRQNTATSSVKFADLDGAPKANAIVSFLDFLVAFNVDDTSLSVSQGFGPSPQRWWCCAAGNVEDWVPDIATQATTGELVDSEGGITAAAILGESIIVYKQSSIYVGRYVGPPFVLSFVLLSDVDVGSISPKGVASSDRFHYFLSERGFYRFDGIQATPIGRGRIDNHFFSRLHARSIWTVTAVHVPADSRVFWFYRSADGGADETQADEWVCYNYLSDKWGKGRIIRRVTSAVTAFDHGVFHWEQSGTAAPVAYNSAAFKLGTVGQYSSTNTSAHFATSVLGKDDRYTMIDRVRPRLRRRENFTADPRHARIRRDHYDGTPATAVSVSLSRGAFDFVGSARFHSWREDYYGGVEIEGWDVTLEEDGLE